MLIQFSVQNYKVFKEEAKLTLFASNYDKETLEKSHVFEVPKFNLRLLKTAVIYGANASGKTKLIDAADFMKTFVINSSKESQQREPINTTPFRLHTATENAPSIFEIVFIYQDEMYRYGFEVTQKVVVQEWLFHRPNTKEVEIFYRRGQEFDVHPKFKKGKLLVKEAMIRANVLFLSVAAQFEEPLAKNVLAWFDGFQQLSGLVNYMHFTMHHAEEMKPKLLEMLRLADIGIDNFYIEHLDFDTMPENMASFLKNLFTEQLKTLRENGLEPTFTLLNGVKTQHKKYNEANQWVNFTDFDMEEEESHGTRKFFALLGIFLNALENGAILLIDELDNKLHPNLVRELLKLFYSATTNPKNAQLIFNTHNTNLLSNKHFRRDQIWFTEKDRYGAATLYSLSNFKTDDVRKQDNFEQKYLQGRYGGVPILQDFSAVFQSE